MRSLHSNAAPTKGDAATVPGTASDFYRAPGPDIVGELPRKFRELSNETLSIMATQVRHARRSRAPSAPAGS